MRVTIEHREQAVGLSGKQHHYFVDCTVDLSQEERAIVENRGLHQHFIEVGYSSPPDSGAKSGLLQGFVPLVALAGVGLGISSMFTKSGEGLSFLLLLAAGGMWLFGRTSEFKAAHATPNVTLGQLLNNNRFTVYAASPAQAKQVDAELREKLVILKANIADSADIGQKQTFEL